MAKFGRSYLLNIQTQQGNTLTIAPPFTVEFDITRNVLTSANVASIRVYNLNENHRNQIRKNVNDFGDLRLIELKAGYGLNLPVIFSGNITQAWSAREGTNFVTQMESFDGGFAFANSAINQTMPVNSSQEDVINSFIENLKAYGVQKGAVGTFEGKLSRNNSYSGNTIDLLKQLTNGNFFIDNGKAYALNADEYVNDLPITIDASTGLLNTPIVEQTLITFDILFEPRLTIGSLVNLKSMTTDLDIISKAYAGLTGPKKVVMIKHRGMISDSVCGDVITTAGLFYPVGSQGLKPVARAK